MCIASEERVRISEDSSRKQNLTHCKEDISSDENDLKNHNNQNCYLSFPFPEMSRQTVLQQEIATHIRSIINPQYDRVFEQGFKNKVYSLPRFLFYYFIFQVKVSRIMTVQQWSKCLSLVNLIRSFDLKDVWKMLLLTHWKFKDVVSTICHLCAMTKLSELNGLRRQGIIYLKVFSNKVDFIYSHLKFI